MNECRKVWGQRRLREYTAFRSNCEVRGLREYTASQSNCEVRDACEIIQLSGQTVRSEACESIQLSGQTVRSEACESIQLSGRTVRSEACESIQLPSQTVRSQRPATAYSFPVKLKYHLRLITQIPYRYVGLRAILYERSKRRVWNAAFCIIYTVALQTHATRALKTPRLKR
jgi:hypothetical protein